MGQSVEDVYIQTYETNVRHLAQQGITRLRPWVMEKSVQSEAHNWERIAQAEANRKGDGSEGSNRAVPTPDDDTEWSRRQSVPLTYHVGDVTEQEDIVQMIVDPNSNYAMAHSKAMRRAHDDEIIAAATGDSRDGEGGVVPFPADQIVGDYTDPLSFDLITEVSERFMENNIDPDDEKVMVIGPKQARKLLQLTEATSGDYNAVRPLTSKGYIESWMGYTWIVSTRLLEETPGEITCFAMTRKALGFQVNRDITARIQEDPSISFAWRIYCFSTFGAIRVEDEHIVQIQLADTV